MSETILDVSEKDNGRNDSLAKRPVTDAVGSRVARENRWGQGFTFAPLPIDRFKSRGQQLCKMLGIKESFNM